MWTHDNEWPAGLFHTPESLSLSLYIYISTGGHTHTHTEQCSECSAARCQINHSNLRRITSPQGISLSVHPSASNEFLEQPSLRHPPPQPLGFLTTLTTTLTTARLATATATATATALRR